MNMNPEMNGDSFQSSKMIDISKLLFPIWQNVKWGLSMMRSN